MWFDQVTYKPQDDLVPVADNAFAADFIDYDHDGESDFGNNGGPSGDCWMTLSVLSSKADVADVWDVLNP